jgi:hypothetical protein
MARDEGKRVKRLQQRRQHGHDVVHHGLAHGALPLLDCCNVPPLLQRSMTNAIVETNAGLKTAFPDESLA